jgi:hypothetical protein
MNGRPSVQVLVIKATAELRRRLPASLEGYPVQIVQTGVIRAQPGESG